MTRILAQKNPPVSVIWLQLAVVSVYDWVKWKAYNERIDKVAWRTTTTADTVEIEEKNIHITRILINSLWKLLLDTSHIL